MVLNIPQYILEASLGLFLFWGYFQLLLQRHTEARLTRWYLLFATTCSLLAPLYDWRPPFRSEFLAELSILPSTRLSGLIEPTLPERWEPYLAGWTVTFGDLAALIYFMGLAILSFRLIDRLWNLRNYLAMPEQVDYGLLIDRRRATSASAWLGHLLSTGELRTDRAKWALQREAPRFRWWHFSEVIVMEMGVIVLWFNPLVYRFRDRLRQVYARIVATDLEAMFDLPDAPARRVDLGPWWKYTAALPLGALLMAAFSFNYSEEMPAGQPLTVLSEQLNDWSAQPLFEFQSAPPTATFLYWGNREFPLAPIQPDGRIDYRVSELSPFYFYLLQHSRIQLSEGDRTLQIRNISASIAAAFSDELIEVRQTDEFYRQLEELPANPELTLYLRIEEESGRSWLAIVSVTKDGSVYGDREAVRGLLREVASLQWSLGADIWEFRRDDQPRYELLWGEIRTELEKYANPNVYTGSIEVDLETFLKNTRQPLTAFRDGQPVPIEFLELNRFHFSRKETYTWRLQVDTVAGFAILPEKTGEMAIADKLKAGDDLSLFGSLGEIQLNTVHIRIKDPNGLFEPQIAISHHNQNPADFGFQVISREGYKTRLKIDTTDTSTRHILDMYRDQDRFEIIHVPGFKTNNRLVSAKQKDPLLNVIASEEREDWFYTDFLPEFTDYQDEVPHLIWGNIYAMPSGDVYSLEDYRASLAKEPRMTLGDRELEFRRCLVVVVPEGEKARVLDLSADDLRRADQLSALQEVGPRTSVLLTSILIADPADPARTLHYPGEFLFHIGHSEADAPYRITIEEVEPTGAEPGRESLETQELFTQYPLTELIAHLNMRASNRVEYHGLGADPLLRVRFEGGGISPDRVQELILLALQQRYHFTCEFTRLPRDHWVVQVDNIKKLREAEYKNEDPPEEKVQVFEHDGYHILSDFTIADLARFLEERYEVIFDTRPYYMHGESFIFGLNFASFEEVKLQLKEEYGIGITDSNWLWDGMIVRFSD